MNNFGRALITFLLGMILSIVAGGTFNEGGLAVSTAVCYLAAIIVWLYFGTENKRRDEN